VDPHGAVYVADPGNQRVLHLWGDGTFLSELGGPGGLGGTTLAGASAVAVAPASGELYVADAGHNRVLAYSPEGSLQASWGAPASAVEFNGPAALATDGAGDVFVADRNNNRVVELRGDGTPLRAWGSRGSANGHFSSPTGIAVDEAGDVYVLDSENNRVQVFDPSGHFLAKWGLRGAQLGEFSQPSAIALDCAGNLYVADTNNNRVERFDGVSRAPSGCIPAADWPAPLDVAPVLHVRVARRGGVLTRRGLALEISCQRGCRVLAAATLAVRGARRPVSIAPAARRLPVALTAHLRLRVGSLALRILRRELGARRAMTARVTIIAAGPTGRRTLFSQSYAVTR
jgi:sugar lactone lactonase YvrE